MQHRVTIELNTREPIRSEHLRRVAELGAVAGEVGEQRLTTTLIVSGATPGDALDKAIVRLLEHVNGEVTAAEVLRADESERRRALWTFPVLLGLSEVAARLGISRQRAHKLAMHTEFPPPVARLASGPIWSADDVDRFESTWAHRSSRAPYVAE